MKKNIILFLFAATGMVQAQQIDTLTRSHTLEEVSVGATRSEGVSRMGGAVGGIEIGQGELFRAACCNLGESFVTNPSVDVNYNDAAVGARQIKLLGLSGQYVQMLVEGLPMAGGAAQPYLLGYVPGAWTKSIAVSKGTSSVKQGFQSITGQINVEYLKPEDEQGLSLNLYGNSLLKAEGNLVANLHLNSHLSTELLAHYEQDFAHHDADGDLWHDSPAVRQLNLQNRWKYVNGRYIMHAGVGLVDESREGGQLLSASDVPFRALVDSRRYEAYMKHAILLDSEHNTNLALTATAVHHALDGAFGNTDHPEDASRPSERYANKHNSLTSQLILEHDFDDIHSLSAGLSIAADRMEESLSSFLLPNDSEEVTPGAYVQYTFKPNYHFTAMAGLRADRSSLFGTFATPRLHLKWMVNDWVTFRGSVGKGYRTTYPLAEHHYLIASGRTLNIGSDPLQEQAWNSGISGAFTIPAGDRNVLVNAEFYHTEFQHQAVVDYDSDPSRITIADLDGRSFSSTLQVDASCDIVEELNVLAAFRYNYVRCTYGGELMEKPLQSRYKGLLTLSWKPMMALWQVDLTLQFNGPGRVPEYTGADGTLVASHDFPAYPQLNLQVTREFRHFSLYVGGENLTNYRQPDPVVNAANPWSATFDPTLVWGPVHGIMAYAGLRMNIGKL
ncbi:MAG: TonB-dependent receptor [Bacteroidales bacterium]|nr:TonB-dependent receptor [Bacteroidales bacterium]